VQEQKQAPLGKIDELTPDSSFLALAREFMDHVESAHDQRDTTRHENRRLIEKKIAPYMGALAIREIKASTVLRVYKAIHNETPSTARNVKALISQMCSYAVMNDLMVAKPAREVKRVLATGPDPSSTDRNTTRPIRFRVGGVLVARRTPAMRTSVPPGRSMSLAAGVTPSSWNKSWKRAIW
jgi:hypothetical protein